MRSLVLGLGLLASTLSFGQINDVELSGSNTFISAEFKYEDKTSIFFNPYGNYKYEYLTLRLGPKAKSSLIFTLDKAIEWAELNKTLGREFMKKVNEFKVMTKRAYQKYGYSSNHAGDMYAVFYGKNYGYFTLSLDVNYQIGYKTENLIIEITSIEELKRLRSLLVNSKVKKDINDIFK